MRIRFRKSQVEAPIELFVAVIILTMSMALALNVWNSMQEQQCVARIKTTMSRVQNALVSIAISSPPTTRIETIDFPRCGNYNIKAVQFAYFSKPEYCRLCPGQYGGCWQLIPLSYGSDGTYSTLTDAITCVQTSGQISLAWDGDDSACSGGGSEDNFNNCPCPTGGGESCTACQGRIHFVDNPDFAHYYSLSRPQSGNTFILRFVSSSKSATEPKIINVCAFTPDKWNQLNLNQQRQ
ncbi:MAG: hypothetical protein V1817_01105 [Candidatus Micrarchaeota archaeon]